MNPWNTELGGKMFDRDTDMSQLVWCIFCYLVRLSLNLVPLYTVVSRNVISWGEVVDVNLRRLWKLFAVWKKSATSCAGAFSHIIYSSSLKRA